MSVIDKLRKLEADGSRVGGELILAQPDMNDNFLLHMAAAIGRCRLARIDAVYLNDDLAIDGTGAAVGKFADVVHRYEYRLGTPGQTVIDIQGVPDKSKEFLPLMPFPYIYLCLRWESELFWQGVPYIAADVVRADTGV